ncbi:extracellular matrix protein 1 [Spea bombifrons]|uniref:extracellular matrix protein 1 n=1 Tax=Spea bombifrons TaxID=233779 RepID=UPI00234B42F4|nr:extracellular matrix protein 1 [Spea bombifrons]
MDRLFVWIITLQLSFLVVHAVTDDGDMYQREVLPELPMQMQREVTDDWNMYQREVLPEMPIQEQREVRFPLPHHGEPVMSPRGHRPVAGRISSVGSNVKDFPPGRPDQNNIGNICNMNRPITGYGPHNLPQTGFSHLSRQGEAMNNMENGYARCCRQADKLHCAVQVWKNSLETFCDVEFSIKTRHYHCCWMQGSEREACFASEAPNPRYVFPSVPVALQEIGSADVPSLGSSRGIISARSRKVQKHSTHGLPDLSFPPGEPRSSNIQNICKLRKFRPIYTQDMLPQSGFGFYVRQAKTINRLESEFKKCCKDENVVCAHTAWDKVLAKFCLQERTVKTKRHECCAKRDRPGMFSCFAKSAPYPEYDREVETMNLSNVTVEDLQILCGENKLLTKHKQIPLLVSSLKESCCGLLPNATLECVETQKEKFIETLCTIKKNSWKDSESCCKKETPERDECFTSYLQDVSVAVSHRKQTD